MLALGFPVTAGLAWAFDLTRRGIERTAPVGGRSRPPRRGGTRSAQRWRMLALVGALLGAAVAGLAGWHLWGRESRVRPRRAHHGGGGRLRERDRGRRTSTGSPACSSPRSSSRSGSGADALPDGRHPAGTMGATPSRASTSRWGARWAGPRRARCCWPPSGARRRSTPSRCRRSTPARDEYLFTLRDGHGREGAPRPARPALGADSAAVARADGRGGLRAMHRWRDDHRSLEAYQHYFAGQEAWHRDGLRAVGLAELEGGAPPRSRLRPGTQRSSPGCSPGLAGPPRSHRQLIQSQENLADRLPEGDRWSCG